MLCNNLVFNIKQCFRRKYQKGKKQDRRKNNNILIQGIRHICINVTFFIVCNNIYIYICMLKDISI